MIQLHLHCHLYVNKITEVCFVYYIKVVFPNFNITWITIYFMIGFNQLLVICFSFLNQFYFQFINLFENIFREVLKNRHWAMCSPTLISEIQLWPFQLVLLLNLPLIHLDMCKCINFKRKTLKLALFSASYLLINNKERHLMPLSWCLCQWLYWFSWTGLKTLEMPMLN